MVNFNGTLQDTTTLLTINNRAYAYGDGLFETIRAVHGKLGFWEDHYFRLMSSMRMLRMEIPMNFTMEFLQDEILRAVHANKLEKASVKVRLSVYREEGGLYDPQTNSIGYVVQLSKLESDFYLIEEAAHEVDLFKDHYVNPGILSTIKTNNRIINVLGSIFAKENSLGNCLLLNTDKKVVEALNGNLFVVKGNLIKTPPLADGCLRGIIRKQLMEIINSLEGFELLEESVSPFELQKADELFTTNVISGIKPITKYRKKDFDTGIGKMLLGKLNMKLRLQ